MKKIIALLLTVLLCFSLCACGVCELCEGTETQSCYMCNGRGERHKIDCYYCKGAGYKIIKCNRCNMTGKIRNPVTWETFTCPSCDGKLTIKEKCSYSGIEKCTVCDGAGTIPCSCVK